MSETDGLQSAPCTGGHTAGEATAGVLGAVQTPEYKRDMDIQDRLSQKRVRKMIKAQKLFSYEESL